MHLGGNNRLVEFEGGGLSKPAVVATAPPEPFSAVIDEKLYFLGGYDYDENVLPVCEK